MRYADRTTCRSRPQLVPAWVRQSNTFTFAVEEGSLLEVEIKTPPPIRQSGSGPGAQSNADALSPGREFPRMMHHATEQPRMVSSKQEELGLGPEWSRQYIHQDYPKCKYHWSGKDVTVKSAEEEAALEGWYE